MIEFDDEIIQAWQSILLAISTEWEGMCEEQLNSLPATAFKQAVDLDTVNMTKKLREALAILATHEAIPVLRYLKPLLIAVWNMVKVGVDVQSRMLKHLQVTFECFAPDQYFFDRYLKHYFLNCHRLQGVLRVYSEMRDGKIRNFYHYRKRMNRLTKSIKHQVGKMGKQLSEELFQRVEKKQELAYPPQENKVHTWRLTFKLTNIYLYIYIYIYIYIYK
jgi:hypothetical protein